LDPRVLAQNRETQIFGIRRIASVLFFGSARAKDREGWEKAVAKAEEELAAATDDESRKVGAAH